MRYQKNLCSMCKKYRTRYVWNEPGDYFEKPICIKCAKKLINENAEIQSRWEKREKNIAFHTDCFILSSSFFILLGILFYVKVVSNFNDVIKLFSNGSKTIYFIIFTLLNYVSGYLIGSLTSKMPIWLKLVANFIFTVEITLVGCVVVIRENIEWNPILMCIPFIFVYLIIIFILNRIYKIDKRKLELSTLVPMILSCIFCLWAAINACA